MIGHVVLQDPDTERMVMLGLDQETLESIFFMVSKSDEGYIGSDSFEFNLNLQDLEEALNILKGRSSKKRSSKKRK